MSKSNQPHKGNPLYSARMLGVGAAIVVTLAGCTNESKPAPTAVSTVASTQSTTAAPPAQAPTESAQASVPTTESSVTTSPATETPATETPVTAIPVTEAPVSAGKFKDGEYVGDATRADRWGNLQVRAVIQGGQLVKIDIVDFPHSTRRSNLISQAALPTLVSEAIQNQDANVDIVSRATDTSYAFVASLESALNNAAVSNT